MWYVIIGVITLLGLYNYNKKILIHAMSISMHINNSLWKESKKHKENSLITLKQSFQPAINNKTALDQALSSLTTFHENHGQSPKKMTLFVKNLNLPNDLLKKETILRKEINKFYKQRNDVKSKSIAIQLSFEHTKLQLQNPKMYWKNFSGLQKLQSNWKSEEYFNDLLIIMTAYKKTLLVSPNIKRLPAYIQHTFETWNSLNIATQNYKDKVKAYENAKSYSDEHSIIIEIIKYLKLRYKYNPKYKDELIKWCLKDVELYEHFLKEFNEHELFTIDEQIEFHNNPALRKKKLATVSFDRVRKLKYYMVPILDSYDILYEIYSKEKNIKKLHLLKQIGTYIGYIDNNLSKTEIKKITSIIKQS